MPFNQTRSPSFIGFLKKIPIFQGLDVEILLDNIKAEQLHLLKGEAVYTQGESYHRGVYFIESGSARLIDPSAKKRGETENAAEIHLKPSDPIGLSAFLGKTVYLLRAEAVSDLDLIFLNDSSIYALMTASADFRLRFKELVASRLKSVRTISSRYQNIPVYSSVGSVMTSPVISIHPSATLKEAAAVMAKHQVNALILITKRLTIKGFITAASIVKNYSAALEEGEIVNYATTPFTLPLSYPLNVAYEAMKKLNEDYAVIIHKKKPVGLVSKAELSALISETSVTFAASIAEVDTVQELKERVLAFPALFTNYMNNAHSLSELMPKLANWHRIIKKRAFELSCAEFENIHKRLPSNFCITSAGGNALAELGLSFMQSNSMIIMTKDKKEISLCRKFARYFSETLEEIGYSYNSNGVSLNNPAMAKSAEEWKDYFSKTLVKNTPNTAEIRILLDSVYFCGDEEIYWDYRWSLTSLLQERRFIPKELLLLQKRVKLPISDYEYFSTDGQGEGIDLKSSALDFLTNLTQIYAIAGEISHIDTPRRLRHLVRTGLISEELSQDISFAYETIINIIIHEHLDQHLNNRPINFYVTPSKLSIRASKQLKRALHISKMFLSEAIAKFEGAF
jgi:CBS domain-containing protein